MNFVTKLVPVILILAEAANCHVGLTFPPARKYDLDFLDNARTKPPCGMPKGRNPLNAVKIKDVEFEFMGEVGITVQLTSYMTDLGFTRFVLLKLSTDLLLCLNLDELHRTSAHIVILPLTK